jgi:hypothetical protein
MAKTVFFVYFSRDNWWVDFNGQAAGPYATKAAAIASAVPLAEAVKTIGRRAEILAPGDDRRYELVWPLAPERETTFAG